MLERLPQKDTVFCQVLGGSGEAVLSGITASMRLWVLPVPPPTFSKGSRHAVMRSSAVSPLFLSSVSCPSLRDEKVRLRLWFHPCTHMDVGSQC